MTRPIVPWLLTVLLISCGPTELTDLDELDSVESDLSVEQRTQLHTQRVLFNGGAEGYHSYRIPSLVKAPNGTLIAFAEGRKDDSRDYGNINVVYKTSTNDGASWSTLKQVVGSGLGTWGNPTAVVDARQKRVWLFLSWNAADHNQFGTDGYQKIDHWGDRRVFVTHSDDNGASWSQPKDLTASLLPRDEAWDAVGPGIGIQTSDGTLVVPANGRFLYAASDTVARTVWKYKAVPPGTSESTVVELSNGSLLRNDRSFGSRWENDHRRFVTRGTLAGGFPAFQPDPTLLDSKCQGSIFRYTSGRILFLNPASTVERCRMRLRVSYDDGRTWPRGREVYDTLTAKEACDQHKGGYSSITKTDDKQIGMLIEVNEGASSSSHRSIEFHKVNLPWALDGVAEPR